LSAIALVLLPGLGIAQSKGNFLSRFEGNYNGTIRRATTSLLGGTGHSGSNKADATSTKAKDLKEIEESAALAVEEAANSGKLDQLVDISLSVTVTSGSWTVELRHRGDQFGVPLPSRLVVRVPQTLGPLSPVSVDGVSSTSWTARAMHNEKSLNVFFTELDALSEPTQLVISLQEAAANVEIVLWLITRNGHLFASWNGKLVP
jgi:hypothetical protein